MSDAEGESQRVVDKEDHSGFDVLNPFFVSPLRDQVLWLPRHAVNDRCDDAVSILQANSAIQKPVVRFIFGEEGFGKFAGLPEPEYSL